MLILGFLGACKPDEISISHTGSVPVIKTVMAVKLEACDLHFEVENSNGDNIDHLGFKVTVMDPVAAEEPAVNLISGEWSGGTNSAYSSTESVRYSDLVSGTNNLRARFSKGACNSSYHVIFSDVSCRMGEINCAEAVVINE
ncbi:hypothetical protein [Shimia sp. MMG029]|uniref:hypothetical protein n=1 Tax=Shimia sp. MMG029 TaxID=3021978 RepID=UPI0022FDF476|nr:hypothetical protein [Shimia sp. MMG029]MDA5555795.1 hypothetical protein [Shimia sp. MMG029]